MVKEVKTVEEFENILKTNEKVVIDFYADWCVPCKKLAPEFQKLSNQYDSVSFIKINVDTEDIRSLVEDYKITALPTFVFIKSGKEQIGYKVIGSNFTKVKEHVSMI